MFLTSGLAVLTGLHLSVQPADADQLLVRTSSGTVRGSINSTTPHVRHFLQIPYASPPVNDLRWLAPRKISTPSNEPIDCTTLPPACAQYVSKIPTLDNQNVPELLLSPDQPQSEDCLFMSVWAPTEEAKAEACENEKKNEELLPVLIFVHGGGFVNGGINVAYQIPSQWVERSKKHIVVSIQYRLNILGWPNAPGLKDQNLGSLDQRLAVEFVRDNIAAFGGDPNRIVLWGQSAGAISVDLLNFAYPDDPIVSGAIADSGSAFHPGLVTQADPSQSNFTFVAHHFNCNNASETARIDCMRRVRSAELVQYIGSYNDAQSVSMLTGPLNWVPMADERIIFSNYTQRYLDGKVAKIPAIFGSNAREGSALVPYPNPPTSAPNQTSVQAVTRQQYLCPTAETSLDRLRTGLKTYRYLYRGNFTNVSPRYWMGPYHASELPLLFGTFGQYRGEGSALETKTSEAMQDLWLSFAQDPVEAAGWDEFGTGKALVFGKNQPVEKEAVWNIDAVCFHK